MKEFFPIIGAWIFWIGLIVSIILTFFYFTIKKSAAVTFTPKMSIPQRIKIKEEMDTKLARAKTILPWLRLAVLLIFLGIALYLGASHY